MVSPTNGGKKAGKFTRMMAWVDRKLCGGGSGAAAQPESQKPEQFKRTLTPEQLAERKEQEADTEVRLLQESLKRKIIEEAQQGKYKYKHT